MNQKSIWIASFGILILSLFIKGCGEENAGAVQSPLSQLEIRVTQAEVFNVHKRPITWPIQIQGVCAARRETTLSAKISASIERIYVNEGDWVKEGTLLAQFDTRELKAQRDKARANHKSILAQLAKLKAGFRDDEVKQAASQLESANAAYKRLQLDIERQERLRSADMIRKSDYLDFQTRLQIAKADLDRASAAYQLALEGFRAEEITQIEAQVDAARAAFDLADIQYDYAFIRAPLTGRIGKKYIERGEWIPIGRPLFQLQSLDPIWVEAYVAEADVAAVTQGLRAEIRALSYPDVTFEGSIEAVGVVLDPVTRSLPVKINVPNPEDRLLVGMFAQVTLFPKPIPSLAIPKDAIYIYGEDEIVTLAQDGAIKRVHIQTGKRYGERVEVRSGLMEGDSVILSDVGGLPDGSPIQAIPVNRDEAFLKNQGEGL